MFIKLVFISVFILSIGCGISHIKANKYNGGDYGELICEKKLSTFVINGEYGMLPSINCLSTEFDSLCLIIKESKKNNITILCCSGFPGSQKKNRQTTRDLAIYLKSCISSRINNQDQLKIDVIGVGESKSYIMPKDTVIDSVEFKKGEIVTEEKFNLLDKRKASYIVHYMDRIEVYGK